ncbi:type I-B CRISPR-associated endonuclease Cas1b [Paenibacillus alginolyticus]|uniref:CRISPR-associated endonuclease Cas1 n=1 Tax=Paenibacillus alginolyticus TaxID=59839 RepID=A0ABT4G7E4_9BACL|nr:type I-B CRISPR-associated endonuclease Cas1b [Paenibacillus alginolyticus]MCY9692090.1 type I-B CRISPR-associated endonuclease Cas1b [Paenibacillus alginolyticus]MEC0147855.1 type I-B CRISPR-associated endonuclease Cas1b [Paenibacillus alginolyticus]
MKKTIYIFQSGELKRKDNTLFFENEEGRKFIPVEDTQELMIFGELDLNKSLLEFCAQKEITLHFFNHYGYYTGSFYPREHLNSGYMILKQTEHYVDETKRYAIAYRFVRGAANNILRVLKYYRGRGKDLQGIIDTIDSLVTSSANAQTIPELMAYEGNIRESYYKSFDIILDNADFTFEHRTKRPPKNELNALISFGNSILYTQVLSEIYRTHLDPRIGYLHTTNFRRFTLNLDVAEIFKPVLVDRLIFSLIGKKQLTKLHFAKETGGILLTEKGRKIFIEAWDEKLKTTIKHRALNKEVSYRRLMRLELYKLQKHMMGEKEYEPFEALW